MLPGLRGAVSKTPRRTRRRLTVIRVTCLVGARPNFIKSAPLLRAMRSRASRIRCRLVHSGQHYDYVMSQTFFDELGLPAPRINLGVGSGSHAEQTGKIMTACERVFRRERPDWVVVLGDVNSTLAGALAAAKLHIPVAHVEAGLRSFNKRMPEEINRLLVDHVSELLFCPTRQAVENLKAEGIRRGVHRVGDVMYDAVRQYLALARRRSTILRTLGLAPRTYALATVHRAENTETPERLAAILSGLSRSGERVILPLHPRTWKVLRRLGRRVVSMPRLRLIPPVSYLDMLMLEQHARVIVTDSGGVQKEALFFRVPCLTVRDETEWVETVESGWNELVGADAGRIGEALTRLRRRGYRPPWHTRSISRQPFGDGHASERIVELLLRG
ncbi:MAG: UDP-N-acetylglucosamine 2-epimerase (non-hydrolyzing) [Candidatus Omnitrophica bacterium]|nr:UDP-N-acetylglucosamine 2-epimerase (non-hydrolyzing) [Candidatus Omnitrophota bacterium]